MLRCLRSDPFSYDSEKVNGHTSSIQHRNMGMAQIWDNTVYLCMSIPKAWLKMSPKLGFARCNSSPPPKKAPSFQAILQLDVNCQLDLAHSKATAKAWPQLPMPEPLWPLNQGEKLRPPGSKNQLLVACCCAKFAPERYQSESPGGAAHFSSKDLHCSCRRCSDSEIPGGLDS